MERYYATVAYVGEDICYASNKSYKDINFYKIAGIEKYDLIEYSINERGGIYNIKIIRGEYNGKPLLYVKIIELKNGGFSVLNYYMYIISGDKKLQYSYVFRNKLITTSEEILDNNILEDIAYYCKEKNLAESARFNFAYRFL